MKGSNPQRKGHRSKVYLGLGGNLGDRKAYLNQGIELLKAHESIEVVCCSSFYETAPVGYIEQGWFLNAALVIETLLPPQELLNYCHGVEQHLGRQRDLKTNQVFGPRTLDIDLLIYEGCEMNEPSLTLPHPRMHERLFVLIPLQEIAPALEIHGQPIGNLIAKFKEKIILQDAVKQLASVDYQGS